MSDDSLAERLVDILRVQLRGNGRDAIALWLNGYDSGQGHLLLLKAPTPGHKIVETGFQTGNVADLI